MEMTQLEINNWIRTEFKIRIMRELGKDICIWYYNDLYKTGNRRMIFKVYNRNPSPTLALQRANAIVNTYNCILNRMRTYKIQEGWEIVEEGGYIALVKYTKSPEFLKKQRDKELNKKRAKERTNTCDGKFVEIDGIRYQLKRV